MRTLMALREYFDCGQLDHSMPLDNQGILRYHWSNHDLARRFQKENLRQNPRPKVRLDQMDQGLEALKQEPVWVSNNLGHIKLDLYTLYAQFSDPNIRKWMMSVPHMLISTCAQSGPFVPLSSMRWFNSDIYRRFVLKRILLGNFPVREFRLETQLPVQMVFDEYAIGSYMAKLHQITPRGIVLMFNNPMIIQMLREKKSFNLNISWGELLRLGQGDPKDMLSELQTRQLRPVFTEPYCVRLLPSMAPAMVAPQTNEHALFIPYQCMFNQDFLEGGARSLITDESRQIVNALGQIKLGVEKTLKFAA